MLTLPVKNIITLKYLTNYNISLIEELCEQSVDWDALLNTVVTKRIASDSAILNAIELAKIAIEKLDYYSISAIPFYDDRYPAKLRQITDRPPIIYIKGNLTQNKLAAVVGSRKMSPYGDKITRHVVNWLDDLGYGVVSGLALGIDSVAHHQSIGNNQYTIAVMPNSLDTVYPNENYYLANQILDAGGCLVSEMIFGLNRGKRTFVQRNRIQAALSNVVIPVEMGRASGTMHTINFSYRYKKTVLVMEPTPTLQKLEAYSGILELLRHRKSGLNVFRDESSFKNRILSLDKSNLNLFGDT